MIKDFSGGERTSQSPQPNLEEQAERVWNRTHEMLQRGSRNFFRRSILWTLNERGNQSIDIRDIHQMVRPLLSEKDKGENGGWEFVNNELNSLLAEPNPLIEQTPEHRFFLTLEGQAVAEFLKQSSQREEFTH